MDSNELIFLNKYTGRLLFIAGELEQCSGVGGSVPGHLRRHATQRNFERAVPEQHHPGRLRSRKPGHGRRVQQTPAENQHRVKQRLAADTCQII